VAAIVLTSQRFNHASATLVTTHPVRAFLIKPTLFSVLGIVVYALMQIKEAHDWSAYAAEKGDPFPA
jgi:hypothetical protein